MRKSLPECQPPDRRRRSAAGGVWNTFREELAPSSIWLRNSLRTGLGVAVAVFVARSLAVPFAFWVVLGTLSALRSNVSATGRSALLALGGTALGVLIAVPFVGLTGGAVWLWWVVLPLLVFLAAYTPAAVNFVVGQLPSACWWWSCSTSWRRPTGRSAWCGWRTPHSV